MKTEISHIIVSKCECGKSVIPPRTVCPRCSNKMKDVEINSTGFVYSFTTLYSVQEGFTSPLNLVLVELENNINVLCEYLGEKNLEIGDKGIVIQKNGKYLFTLK